MAGVSGQQARPSPPTAASAEKQPPQVASTLTREAPSVRSPPIQPPELVPIVRLPPVAPSKATETTQQNPTLEEPAKSLRKSVSKSVRFAEFTETAEPRQNDSIFGPQVDQAPMSTAALYIPPVTESHCHPLEAKGSYLDDLLGLDIEPDIAVGETEVEMTKEPVSTQSQNEDQQQQTKKDESNQEALMRKELKNIQYILVSLRATGLASKEIVAYYEDRVAAIMERIGAQALPAGEKAEAPSATTAQTVSKDAEMTGLSNTIPIRNLPSTDIATAKKSSYTRASSSNDTPAGIPSSEKTTEVEHLTTKTEQLGGGNSEQLSESETSSDAGSSSQAQPDPRTASKPTLQTKGHATISPLGLPPLPVFDLRASLWQSTIVSIPSRGPGSARGAWDQLHGEDLIGERVLPGRPDPSQVPQPTASAGTPLSTTLVTKPATTSPDIPTSTGLVSKNAPIVETPRSHVSTMVRTPSSLNQGAAPLLLPSTTSNFNSITLYDKAKAETPTVQSDTSTQKQPSTKPVAEPAAARVPTIPATVARADTPTTSKVDSSIVAPIPFSHDFLVAGQSGRDQDLPNIPQTRLPPLPVHQPTTTTSSPFSSTTERKADSNPTPTPSQAQSIARPNITGRVLPNIPDSAATRQYARSPPLASPTASTIIAAQGVTQAPKTISVTQLEDSLNQFHITGSSTTRPQNYTTSRQPQSLNSITTLAGSFHQPQGNTQSSRRGAAPMLSPFLQSLQNMKRLPPSGVGSATWLQYNPGSAPAAKDFPTSENSTTSELHPHASEAQPPAKDAWGRVRRAGN